MLEHYFVKPSTIDKIRGSWLGSQIESYVEWMEVHGYARPTVLRRVPLLFHFAEFAKKRGCTEIASATAFVEEFVSLWLSQHGAEARRRQCHCASIGYSMRAQSCRCCGWPARGTQCAIAAVARFHSNPQLLVSLSICDVNVDLKKQQSTLTVATSVSLRSTSAKPASLRSASCPRHFWPLSLSNVRRGWLPVPVVISVVICGYCCGSVTVRGLRTGI
jgi:hypothetical protein